MLPAASGCSSSQTSEVSAAARGFYDAVGEGDGARACALLSPETRSDIEKSAGKSCADAVLDEDLPEPANVGEPSVYGTMAFVPADDDAMFLGRFPQGWLVTAVGCRLTDQASRYDCAVSGG
jgi:hypothetical protein